MLKKIWILLLFFLLISCQPDRPKQEEFAFIIAADMRNYAGDNVDYFRGACEAIRQLDDSIRFVISPGDIDPMDSVLYCIRKYIREDMIWYPVVGNHENETPEDMVWLRNFNSGGKALPFIVNQGPEICRETTYSFDVGNTHFIILNQYADVNCDDCTDGDMPDILYDWLKGDLQMTRQKHILVIGHEPAYPLPDMENQRFRHEHDSLNRHPENRDRFVELLQDHGVTAYIFGHTHNYSVVKINRLWHMDAGHARGIGDRGARSTFIKMMVNAGEIRYETYRLNVGTMDYEITDRGILN